MIKLSLTNIREPESRENFQKVEQFLRDENLLASDFKFFELTFTKAETNKRIPHGLGFTPKDVIQTSSTGAGALTWNYALFNAEFLDITTTGSCVVRAFIGNYAPTGA